MLPTRQGHLSRRLDRLPWPNLPMTLPLRQRTARTRCLQESIRTRARFQPFSTRRRC